MREWAFFNASSNVVGTVLALAVWFLVTPVVLHHLGVAQYGLWVLASAIVAYAPLLDLGIGDAITRYVAAHRAQGDSLGASRFIAAGFWIYIVLAALTLALTVLLAPFFGGLFHLPKHERSLAGPVVALAGLNVAVAFPAITNLAVLRGIQRFDLVNIVGTGSTIVTGIVIVIVLHAGRKCGGAGGDRRADGGAQPDPDALVYPAHGARLTSTCLAVYEEHRAEHPVLRSRAGDHPNRQTGADELG